ncbi:MAG: hypothetical protein AAF600_05330 [Bacteroidota bacterium]
MKKNEKWAFKVAFIAILFFGSNVTKAQTLNTQITVVGDDLMYKSPGTDASRGGNHKFIGSTRFQDSVTFINQHVKISNGDLTIERGQLKVDDVFMVSEETGYWKDEVLRKEYDLLPLKDLQVFINEKGHLPKLLSEKNVYDAGGYNLRELDMTLLEKVEELTLYILQQEQKITDLEKRLSHQETNKP